MGGKLSRQLVVVVAMGGLVVLWATAAAGAATRPSHLNIGPGGTFVPAPASPTTGEPFFAPLAGPTLEYSLNWSGYAQSAPIGTFTSVEDTWKIPTVTTTLRGSQFSADWVGIGGFSDSTLVQAGTSADNIDGTAQYQAWTELLPAAEDPLPMTVHAGDSITTVVQRVASGKWLLQVSDTTTGVTESRTVSYSSYRSSAEAIHEATTVCDSTCSIAPLAKTTTVSFDPGYYTSWSQTTKQPLLVPAKVSATTSATLYKLEMVSLTTGAVIATPSGPNAANDGFAVAYGAKAPSPPS